MHVAGKVSPKVRMLSSVAPARNYLSSSAFTALCSPSTPVWPLDPTAVLSVFVAKISILIVCRSRCMTLSPNPLNFRSVVFASLLAAVSSAVMFSRLFALF
ncbi:hypothetical protein V6N13_143990 [Hibiscus sabdariffa]